jgi:hypothetical protein
VGPIGRWRGNHPLGKSRQAAGAGHRIGTESAMSQ